jgi:hypothetical protein
MSTTSGSGPVGREELANVDWHISSRTNSNGMSCVEAGPLCATARVGSRCATATTRTTR